MAKDSSVHNKIGGSVSAPKPRNEAARTVQRLIYWGESLVEAAGNLLADQAVTWDDVSEFEILSARKVGHDFMAHPDGTPNPTKPREVWEFEVYCRG